MTPRLPIPNSWYAVAFTDELPAGAVLRRRLAGEDIVVYRTQSGQAMAIDPFCPHLGAHLGYGGTVSGEEIVCPFHAFRFDTSGQCTATGYGTKPPPKARLRMWPVRELNGIVFVYYDSQGCAPDWEPTAYDTTGWTPLRHRTFPLRDHPQETVENGVDIGHFAIVHGYSHVNIESDLEMSGPLFRTAYSARRAMPLLGRFGATIDFHFALSIHGLGFSLVHVTVPRFGLQSRLFILATPTEAEGIDLHLCLSQYQVKPGRIHPLLGFLPGGWLTPLVAYFIHEGLLHDAQQDFPIWENKRFIHPPALAEGDGPIGKFRYWARQFYHREDQPAWLEAPAAD